MKAVVMDRFGGPEVLEHREHPTPEPSPRQVRVAVRACGVCRHDLLTRAGAFPDIALPVVLGHQICGVVDRVGSEVEGLQEGDRVLSLVYETCGRCRACLSGVETQCRQRPVFIGEDTDGGYAEYVVADERAWVRLPDAVDDVAGAVITCTLGTSFHAIVTRGEARAGETAVVTGASGGVGLHALQILRATGVRSIAVTSSAAKEQLLRDAGADVVVVSDADGRYAPQVKEVTGGEGVDIGFEIVGGRGITETIHCLRFGGRAVVVGNVEGKPAEIKPAHFILKEISLIGTKAITRLEMERLLSLISRGVLVPEAGETLPLAEAAEAHRAVAENRTAGRLVLTT
jgi:acryloyl-coenzyme A reductase